MFKIKFYKYLLVTFSVLFILNIAFADTTITPNGMAMPWIPLLLLDDGNGSQTISLSIILEGSGSGRVSSFPAGIYCENDCAEDYASNTGVVLSAQPYTGSVFMGWNGGGCSGTGSCNLTMINDTTVTAKFVLTQPEPLSLVTP